MGVLSLVSNEEIKRRLDRKRRGLEEIHLDEKSIKCKTCPYCKFKNPENSIFCVKCGRKLEKNDNIKCSTCSTLNPKTAKFCIKCGKNLTIKETTDEQNPNDNQSDTLNQKTAPNLSTGLNKSENKKSETNSIKNIGMPSSIPDQNLINPKGNKKTCPVCDSKNLKTAKFCVVCGEKFVDTKIEKSVKNTDQKLNDKENSKSGEIDDPIEKIKRAKELLDIGAITEEEFESIKSKYLDLV